MHHCSVFQIDSKQSNSITPPSISRNSVNNEFESPPVSLKSNDTGKPSMSLNDIAAKLKFEVFDLDGGRFGLESKDRNYGIEIIRSELSIEGGLGINLEELAAGMDGRGMCLVSNIVEDGNAAKTQGKILPGDMICYIGKVDNTTVSRCEGLDLDRTLDSMMQVVIEAKEEPNNHNENKIFIVVKRLVKLATIDVTFVYDSEEEAENILNNKSGETGKNRDNSITRKMETTIPILAGSNLRKAMMQNNLPIYDRKTKRYDQPYITGNCSGEGICGTCLVQILQGHENLSTTDDIEKMSQEKWKAVNWRLSCRLILGPQNKDGKVRIKLQPQKQFEK